MTQKWFHINILETVIWLITSNIENNKLHKTSVRSKQPQLVAAFTSLTTQRNQRVSFLRTQSWEVLKSTFPERVKEVNRKSQRSKKGSCSHQGTLLKSYETLLHLIACPVGIAWFRSTCYRDKTGGKVCCYSTPKLRYVKHDTMHNSSSIYFLIH